MADGVRLLAALPCMLLAKSKPMSHDDRIALDNSLHDSPDETFLWAVRKREPAGRSDPNTTKCRGASYVAVFGSSARNLERLGNSVELATEPALSPYLVDRVTADKEVLLA